jgi:hypothetical protein
MIYLVRYFLDVKYVLFIVQIRFQTSYVSADRNKRSQHLKRISSQNVLFSVSVKNLRQDDGW